MRLFLIGGALVAATAMPGMADTLVVDNPSQWANTSDNEQPVVGDTSKAEIGSSSWASDRSATNGGDQHFLYFQGGSSSQDQDDADPNTNFNPSLFYNPDNHDVSISDINRLSWATNKSSASTSGGDAGPHWFGQFKTTDHLVTFALTDSSNYSLDSWNTLEADQSDDSDSIGDADSDGLEMAVYDQDNFDDGTATKQTFAQWANDADGGDPAPWWNETISYAGIATGTNYNTASNEFYSNLDAVEVSTDSLGSRTLDLEAVPAPSATLAALSMLGVLGGGTLLRRPKHARA